jgi:Fic family protein
MVEEASEAAPRRLHASTLRNLHALLAHNLLGDPSDEGRVRTRTVHIHGSTFVPLDVPPQVEECLTQIALTAAAIDDAFEQSFFLLVQIPYLQPFIAGNKRTARLAANLPFIRDNLRPLTFVDVPQAAYIEAILAVYELRRVELLQDVFRLGLRALVRALCGGPEEPRRARPLPPHPPRADQGDARRARPRRPPRR